MVQDLDAVLGVARRVGLHDARQVLHADGRHARDRHVAAPRLAGLAQLDQRAGEVAHEPARLRQEPLPDVGQRDRTGGALHQANAQQRLQVLQPPGQRGLGDVQGRRRLAEAALLRDGDERLDPERVYPHEPSASIININSFHESPAISQARLHGHHRSDPGDGEASPGHDRAQPGRGAAPAGAPAHAGGEGAARTPGRSRRGELEPGASELFLRPDRVVFQDVLGQSGLLQFMQTGRGAGRGADLDPLRPPDPGARRRRAPTCARRWTRTSEVYDFLRSAAAKYGAGFWGPGAGIIHQVVLENYAFPGALILGTDSHTPNAGGLGACAVGVGGADAVEVIAGLPWEAALPATHRGVPDRRARRLDRAEGRDPLGRGPARQSRAAPTRSSSTSVRARARSARRARRPSPTWAPSSARPRRCSRPTSAWRAISPRPAAPRSPSCVGTRGDLLAPDPEVEARPEKFYERVLALDLVAARAARRRARTRPTARGRSRSSRPRSATRRTASRARSRPR